SRHRDADDNHPPHRGSSLKRGSDPSLVGEGGLPVGPRRHGQPRGLLHRPAVTHIMPPAGRSRRSGWRRAGPAPRPEGGAPPGWCASLPTPFTADRGRHKPSRSISILTPNCHDLVPGSGSPTPEIAPRKEPVQPLRPRSNVGDIRAPSRDRHWRLSLLYST